MRLNDFNESFERMALNEDIINNKSDEVKNRYDKLSKLKELTVKSLSSLDVFKDMDKVKNYVTVLDWICKIVKSFKNMNNENDSSFMKKLKVADSYIEQMAKAIQSGQTVHESLLKESLNYIDK